MENQAINGTVESNNNITVTGRDDKREKEKIDGEESEEKKQPETTKPVSWWIF